VCGWYEGIDEWVFDDVFDWWWVMLVSLGDYVLNGGEVVVFVIVEVVGCLLFGVVGNVESLVEESYEDGLLEYFVYIKLVFWCGCEVLFVLLFGYYGVVVWWWCD